MTNARTKVLKAANAPDLQEQVNAFLNNDNIYSLSDIKYSTSNDSYSALVLYIPKDLNKI